MPQPFQLEDANPHVGHARLPYRVGSARNRGRPLAIPLRTDELAPAADSPEQ